MPRKKKYISVLIVPDDGSKMMELRMSRTVVRLLEIILLSFLILIVLGGLSYWKVAQLAFQAKDLKRRNSQLELENRKIVQLEQTLGQIRAVDQRLRLMLGEETNLEERSRLLMVDRPPTPLTHSAEDRREHEQLRWRPSIWPIEEWVTADPGKEYNGIDIVAKRGSIVRAVADGRVTFAGRTDDLGNLVELNHGGFYSTRYGHNSKLLVGLGEKVKRGQAIALLGGSKRSTAPYLHYEVWEGGEPRDPREYFLRP